jgi:hypothetical protein
MQSATSSNNTGVGYAALQAVRGKGNTAVGDEALRNLFGGVTNVGIGNDAGYNLLNGDNNVYISNIGISAESGTTRIGTEGIQTTAYVAGIQSTPLATGTAVRVTGNWE